MPNEGRGTFFESEEFLAIISREPPSDFKFVALTGCHVHSSVG